MKRGTTVFTHRSARIGALAAIVALVGPSPTAQGMATQVDIEITYSNSLTANSAFAIASRIGYDHWLSFTDLSESHSGSGTNTASAAVGTRFDSLSESGSLLDGHFGNVDNYHAMPLGISGDANVSGDTVNLNSGAFFNMLSQEFWDSNNVRDGEANLFLAGYAIAGATVTAPPNTTIQGISFDVTSKYIFGVAEVVDAYGYKTRYTIADPATVISLYIDGQPVSGGYILNEAGTISTYGDLTYDDQAGTFSFDSSALVGLDVSGYTAVVLLTDARLPGDFNDDEVVDDQDIDLLYGQIAASYSPVDAFDLYDLNIDGVVNAGTSSDVEVLVETVMLSKLGDANLDRYIGIEDLNIVLGNWNQTGVGYAGGDMDGDDYVGSIDLNMVLGNWGWGTPPVFTVSIPEPATLSLFAFGLALASRRRG